MVRTYQRKKNRKPTSPNKLKAAVELVKSGWPLRKAASLKGVNYLTLYRISKKVKDVPEPEDSMFKLSYVSRNVFSKEMEDSIAQYCIQMAQMGYGLSVEKARELAWDVAKQNDLTVPENWTRDSLAGIDWFHGFKKRNPNISIRVPEACSVARAMAFNETNVRIFFDKLEEVLSRSPSFRDGSRVYNLDETSISTVQNTRKVISPKGLKQVHQIKGAERGTSVTGCVIINAHGSLIPPVLIFPRKTKLHDLMINAYPGSLALGNEKGYMTKDIFYHVLEHFIECSNSSKENPTLLLLDNVESHFSAKTLSLAKENGTTIFTFPPHCTHRLQPLDVGFFGPFKTFYDQEVTSYLRSNPATPPTIYRIAGFVREALSKAATPHNIIKCFETPGIIPFNRDIFTERDFIMAKVTERPDPSMVEPTHPNPTPSALLSSDDTSVDLTQPEDQPQAASQDFQGQSSSSGKPPSFITPVDIRGFPQAKQCEKKRQNRRKGKCMIATDTPEKVVIEEREREQENKKKKVGEGKRKRIQSAPERKGKKKKTEVQRMLTYETDSSEEADSVQDITPAAHDSESSPPLSHSPKEGEFVLVLLTQAKEKKYFVGKIIKEEDQDGDLEISYLKKKDLGKFISFVMPPVPELCGVHISEIKVLLPMPTHPQTKRLQSHFNFDFNFTKINLG